MILYSIKATDVVLFIFILAGIIIATYFLLKSILKEHEKIKNEKIYKLEGVISKSEMKSVVSTYMNRSNLQGRYSLIYIDLDKFEDFNMAFGEKESKNIVKLITNKIKKILPEGTYLSRLNNDDFLIFLPEKYTQSEVLLIGDELLKSFREKIQIFSNEDVELTATIALAAYPNHGDKFDTLLESLLLTIYSIKKDGGNALRVYSQSLLVDEEHMSYYYQIKNAIANNQFKLFYQPVLDMENKKIYSIESLLRWEHSELGVLSPNKFINIMEQSGDIHWVGQWGFEKVVQMYKELEEKFVLNIPLISVNLSPKQLMSKDLVNGFQKILRKYKVHGYNFILEVGEFTLFDKQAIILENINKLKKLEFKISVGGFGIDILTFDKLTELKIDEVKLRYDSIAEDNFTVNKYVEILSQYTTNHNIKLLCQMVENEDEEKRSLALGIKYLQGYFYSRPLDQNAIKEYLDEKHS